MNQPSNHSSVRRRSTYFAEMIGVLLIAIGAVLGTWSSYGRGWAEKVATQLVMPVGLLSLLLIYALLIGAFRKLPRFFFATAFLFVLLYSAASPITSHWLLTYLESRHGPPEIEGTPPLDTLIVLGGGVTTDRFGRSQLSSAGDRAMWAARLYKTGHARLLVTTGDSMPGPQAEQSDPSSNTRKIWMDLGIPERDIIELPGLNTFQEMQSIQANPALWKGKRTGVISSAFHMPRVMRLANALGVDLIPYPADGRTRDREFNPTILIPSGESLSNTETALRELLGMLLKR